MRKVQIDELENELLVRMHPRHFIHRVRLFGLRTQRTDPHELQRENIQSFHVEKLSDTIPHMFFIGYTGMPWSQEAKIRKLNYLKLYKQRKEREKDYEAKDEQE